ncbi:MULTISPECIES: sugar transferase [Streptomyces]|uniref:Bacterial sugar transferase domain-containing protein n=1 Tax=Streptomyces plumbiresistens TaxID=511811 RepID=A0ABP7T316_9ACTN|nr:sugar transferase [Streptomyces sp. NBC_01373]MCX4705089.1 sugar transferase [Streptomyces sp. NBC_01373]
MDTTDDLRHQALPRMTPVRLTVPRRALDVVVSLALLALLSPLLLFLTVLVRTTSGGPAIFRQRRMGEGAREFTLYKFRTMRQDASGPGLTCSSDSRVTGTGWLLRRFGLDELPQLFNVLRGDMTLVGPRPEAADLAHRYPPQYHWVFRHRPGLTGPCQLRSRSDAVLLEGRPDPEEYYLEVMVPRRAAMDEELLAHLTPATVALFVARTPWYLLSAAWDGSGRSSGGVGGDTGRCTEGGRS